VEQLALSVCASKSAGKLWCGTCHNPHDPPENPAKYYRERCLSCHGDTILQTHALPAGDCISCHMTRRKAKDGAHTVFTDHRIARIPQAADDNSSATPPVGKLVAWHEPPSSLAVRNLGLANIEIGERDHSAEHMEEGARQVVAAMKVLPPDPAMLTKVGLVFLRKGEASDAIDVFEYTLGLDPSRAGSYANLGNAYKEAGQTDKAISELERAIQLDPSLEIAYRSLAEIFAKVKDQDKVRAIYKRYLQFMPESVAMREALIRYGAR
jgi:tetratricopeptide (TPR) repeat protein